tara:strand:- start:275 stop:2110 length:1836 start_codon:yes stop_codon:yes gene_type:complete
MISNKKNFLDEINSNELESSNSENKSISSFFDLNISKNNSYSEKKDLYNFDLPISYLDKNNLFELTETVRNDLELENDISNNNIYNYLLDPKNEFSKENLKEWNKYYTNDINYLEDTQEIIKKMNVFDDKKETNIESVKSIWKETKNNHYFYGKYNYFEWSILKKFNLSSFIMLMVCIINLSSPLIFLIMPLIIMIIPFFILKIKGLPISMSIYKTVLYTVIKEKLFGRFLDKFDTVNLTAIFYVFGCLIFYGIQIYQNISTCYNFYKNIKNVNTYLDDLNDYLEKSTTNMDKFLEIIQKSRSYYKFQDRLQVERNNLILLREELKKISFFSHNISKVSEFGLLLRCFYIVHSDESYENAIQFSVGFNGYLDNMYNLYKLQKDKKICFAEFGENYKCKMEDQYYPVHINDSDVVKNNIVFDSNIIITGPNASGKTTALKSTTLNIIFTQQIGCGFYKSCKLNPYTHIHSYINIPDTSNRDSLFQAESRRCKDIISNIEKKPSGKYRHFCIFDELYSGTNPVEASQAGYAFLKYLSKFDHVDFILTTHYVYICKKLKKCDKISNYKMKVDIINNDYKFRYKMIKGISELKGALKVLKDLDYPKEIIKTIEKL